MKPPEPDNVTLECGGVSVAVNRDDGRVVALGHGKLGIELIGEPRLAASWRLLVSLPEGVSTIVGHSQALTRIEVDEAAGTMALRWDQVCVKNAPLGVSVTQTLTLTDDTLTAELAIDNHSGHTVEEAYPLVVGGLADWARGEHWRMCVPSIIFGGQEWAFYREFPGNYLGYRKPTFAFTYPGTSVDFWQQNLSMPWVSLYDVEREVGVYFGNHNPEIAFSAFWGELTPSADYASPGGRSGPLRWPDPARARREVAIGASIGWAFFPMTDAGFSTPPTVLRFHRGTWWEAARLFRSWFDTAVAPIPRRRDGLARHQAWQNTYLEAPREQPERTFRELPQLARDALDAGIDVIHIAAWHEGGLDAGYPYFAVPSQRLGGADELRKAIAECQRLGVRVMLWVNANQISTDAPDYAETLSQFEIKRPDGRPHKPLAFGFSRLLDVLGFTAPQMVAGNLAHPGFRELIGGQWRAAAELGADAIQIDKVISGEPTHLDFNPALSGSPMSSAHAALIETVGEFRDHLDGLDRPMGLALETGWDRMMPFAEAIYTRNFGRDQIPVHEVTFPEVKATTCVLGEFDFGLVNSCVRFARVIALEGAHLWGTAADVPGLVPYLREIGRLRRELAENLWWASVIEPRFARVEAEGPVAVGALEAWERNPASGAKRALVVHPWEGPVHARITFDPGIERVEIHRPFAPPETAATPLEVELTADEVVVMLAFD
jgi:hypothetical protein